MLKDESGNWIEDNAQIKALVNNFYKELFATGTTWNRWRQTSITYPGIEDEDLRQLDANISNDEIRRAMFEMQPWKAPGPDGFPAGFYQKSWGIVGAAVCECVTRM